jgi:hypothetical protein
MVSGYLRSLFRLVINLFMKQNANKNTYGMPWTPRRAGKHMRLRYSEDQQKRPSEFGLEPSWTEIESFAFAESGTKPEPNL